MNQYSALGQYKISINLKSEYLRQQKLVLDFLVEYPFVHSYWINISVQNYYATKWKARCFPSDLFILICWSENNKQLKIYK